jgi:hypothetical protein
MSGNGSLFRLARWALGLTLIAYSTLPVHRLVDPSSTSTFMRFLREVTDAHLSLSLWGTLLLGLTGLLLARLLGIHRLTEGIHRGRALLLRPTFFVFAGGAAILGAILAAAVSWALYRGLLTNVDEMATLVHARFLAEGQLAGHLPGDPAHWIFVNTLMSPAGWVSQYPVGAVGLVALATWLGQPLFVGPLSLAVAVAAFASSCRILLPHRPGLARLAPLLLAVSPLVLFRAGGLWSHLPALALACLVLDATLRSMRGSAKWSLLVGAAWATMIAVRPWTGLSLGSVLAVGPWILLPPMQSRLSPSRELTTRGGLTLAGGLPFGLTLLAFNRALFLSPLVLGYTANYGASHGLGFHDDPWGFPYSFLHALAYTGVDLVGFGVQLLETPFSVVLPVGLMLLLRRTALTGGERVLLAWALAPLAANAFYWFHEPRMLLEAAPAWLALFLIAGAFLSDFGRSLEANGMGLVRGGALWALALGFIASATTLTPDRVRTFAWTEETLGRITVPDVLEEGGGPSLVFVHTSWNERTASRLHAQGLGADSVEILLREGERCELSLRALQGGFDTGSASPSPALASREPHCGREERSDRLGSIALAPLIWQGDLPGLQETGIMFVRDLGPEANGELMAAMPHRRAYMLRPDGPDRPPVLEDYGEGEALLWGPTR